MVSNDVVMNTVKRMLSSGVDDDTIRMTLKGINLKDTEIDNFINEAKGVSSEKSSEASSPAVPEPEEHLEEADIEEAEEESERTPADVKKELEAVSQEQAAQHTTTHQLLDEHKDKIDTVEKNVTGLHKKIDSTPKLSPETIAKIDVLDTRMSALEKEISETKANTIALQELMKKILETNKKTLIKLEK